MLVINNMCVQGGMVIHFRTPGAANKGTGMSKFDKDYCMKSDELTEILDISKG